VLELALKSVGEPQLIVETIEFLEQMRKEQPTNEGISNLVTKLKKRLNGDVKK
jgi:hypothetical protein